VSKKSDTTNKYAQKCNDISGIPEIKMISQETGGMLTYSSVGFLTLLFPINVKIDVNNW
jgi:hypothetical protein